MPDREEIRKAARAILDSGAFRFGPERDRTFFRWLIEEMQGLFETLAGLHEASPVLYWLVLVACLLILVPIFLHAGIVLARAVRSRRRSVSGPASGRRGESPREILDSARAAARRGDVVLAVSLYLRAAMSGLELRGLARGAERATVREYEALLRGHPGDRALFGRLVSYYEPAVFGRRPLEPRVLSDCDGIARRLAGEST
ncbi:MAG: hypothetical protein HY716_12695 [Planctomycetes bacterium]|nr:hypothetical protein [Planctomycetota bacterium]